MESVPTLQMGYGKWLYNFELFSVVVFTVEYVARVWSAPAKRGIDFTDSPLRSRFRYIFSFYGLIDLVAILHSGPISGFGFACFKGSAFAANTKVKSL